MHLHHSIHEHWSKQRDTPTRSPFSMLENLLAKGRINPSDGILLPPDITSFGEHGRPDDLWCHPGIGARGTHLGGLVPLTCQAKVRDLQCFVIQSVVLHLLAYQNYEGNEMEQK